MNQKTDHAPLTELKFEAAVTELEEIVQAMENGKLELEDSIASYRRGVALMRHCQELLNAAEEKIQVLENDQLRDFVPPGNTA
jgi:exodeoxyribonuclease VII small subunit